MKRKERQRESNYIINGKLYIWEGKILNNPFAKKMDNTEASQWIIRNGDKVREIIGKWLSHSGIGWGNIEDCYDLLLEEFNHSPNLQFNENHFGKDSGYNIEIFIYNRIKYIVKQYSNEVSKEKRNTVPLLNQKESEVFVGEIEGNFSGINEISLEDKIVNTDTEYWDRLYEELVDVCLMFLEERSYKEFDVGKFLYYMYLDVEEYTGKESVGENFKRVSEKIMESYELVETVVTDMSLAVKERDKLGEDILGMIQELLEGRRNGWIPENIRNEN